MRRPVRVVVSDARKGQIDHLVGFLSDRYYTHSATVATALGVTPRTLRRIVADARKLALPVTSGDAGYILGGRQSLRECADRLRAHALDELARAADLERTALNIDYAGGIVRQEGNA